MGDLQAVLSIAQEQCKEDQVDGIRTRTSISKNLEVERRGMNSFHGVHARHL